MKAKLLDFKTEAEIVFINTENEDPSNTRDKLAQIKLGQKRRLVRVVQTDIIPKDHIGIPSVIYESMGIKEGDEITLMQRKSPASHSVIMKKYEHQPWSSDDIRTIVDDIYNGDLSDLEMGAFTLAMQYENLSIDETEHLTRGFTLHGETLEFSEPVFDKHSIGGIPGNKVSLLIVPIIAAAGLLIPKTSSRAITSPSGTADTMEVLADVKFTAEEIQSIAPKTRGMLVWGGQLNLAPVDSEIIKRVERPLSLDPESVIIASILSKKLSTGVKNMVLDMPTGAETKMPLRSQAQALSRQFVEIGRRVGIQIECALTYADQIVGHSAGAALEAREAIATLMGNGPRSVLEKSLELSGILFEMAGLATRGKGAAIAGEIVSSGKALAKFREIIEAQGGDPKVKIEDIAVGQYTAKVEAASDGYVGFISNKSLKQITSALGCPADKQAGIIVHKKSGEFVKKGDVMVEIYATRESRLDRALQIVNANQPWRLEGMVLERINAGSINFDREEKIE